MLQKLYIILVKLHNLLIPVIFCIWVTLDLELYSMTASSITTYLYIVSITVYYISFI